MDKPISNEEGVCPYCNSTELNYGVAEFVDDLVKYDWTCGHCGKSGSEWYSLNFIGHNDEDGNEIDEQLL